MVQYLSKVFFILAGGRKQLGLLIAIFVLTSALEAFGIGLVGPFLWLASDPERISSIPSLNHLYNNLQIGSKDQFIAALGATLALLFCLKSAFYFVARVYIVRYGLQQRSKLVDRLLHAYLSAPYSFFLDEKNSTASLIGRMIKDAEEFGYLCLVPLLELVASLMTTFILIAVLAKADPLLLLLIMVVLLPTFLVFYSLKGYASRWGKQANETHRDMVQIIQHSFGGLKETRVIGCEPYFEAQMSQTSKLNTSAVTKSHSLQILPRVTIEALVIVLVLLVVSLSKLFLGRDVGELLPILSLFAVASIRLIPSSSQALTSWGMVQTSRHAVNMVYSDLKYLQSQGIATKSRRAMSLSTQEKDKAVVLKNSRGEALSYSAEPTRFSYGIELQEVTYTYPSSAKPALENISLHLKKGQSIALIGKSGAGKTTLIDVILGLLEPTNGDICVDGVSIYENLRGWQNLIGYIPQSIFLMDETLERNIAFGVSDEQIDPYRMQRAIEAAQLTELVEQLPLGLKTPVGERGIRLSGGQRQRVGIARALYHEREILVLDEATAALDNETERLVTESIQALSGVKTMIIIAHRLTTVKHCDRIYLVEKGRIVKSGSYQEVVGEAVH